MRVQPNPFKRARNRLLRRALEMGQRVGVNVTPRHYYSAIPDLRVLRRSRHWREPRSMVGVQMGPPAEQLAWMSRHCPPDLRSRLGGAGIWEDACRANGAIGYGPTEAEFLFSFAGTARPSKVVQVGAGVATAVLLRARRDLGAEMAITCIDPHPTAFLRDAAAAGDVELIAEPAETVAVETLTDLGPGDLLFVDSSHAVRPGGEVNQLVLEVLPRLRAGAFVHYHDITFPHDYFPGLLTEELFFWSESVLLHAFLIGNSRFAVRASLSLLHKVDPQGLKEILPNYSPIEMDDGMTARGAVLDRTHHFPSGAWLEVVG
jgi:hypothetical protein